MVYKPWRVLELLPKKTVEPAVKDFLNKLNTLGLLSLFVMFIPVSVQPTADNHEGGVIESLKATYTLESVFTLKVAKVVPVYLLESLAVLIQSLPVKLFGIEVNA
jgi:hypothetical protein